MTILTREETFDPGFVPPRLVSREKELGVLSRRYREALARGIPYHQLLTGGIGSGKTAIAHHVAEDLRRQGRVGPFSVQKIYVNCWRRSNDRTLMLELLRGVGVSLPDRGYALSEMFDVFEQGLRKTPGHRFVILDEVSSLVRQGTRIVYPLTRSREVGLGSISLFLVAPDDVLPFLDAASRSSFGVTHRMALEPYTRDQLAQILGSRAELGLRPGSWDREILDDVARAAASNGDARFALEILVNAARLADAQGVREINSEHVRAAKGSLYPTVTETRLTELSGTALFVLLALARTLRGPKGGATTERVRQTYGTVAEEYGTPAVSRVTFWRTVKELEREGLIDVEPGAVGRPARLSLNDVPASFLEVVLEERVGRTRSRKR